MTLSSSDVASSRGFSAHVHSAGVFSMKYSFVGQPFREITLADAAVLDPILRSDPQPISGFTVAALVGWNGVHHYGFAVLPEGTLLISCHFGDPHIRHLLQPVGPFPVDVQQRIVRAAAQLDYPFHLYGVSPAFLAKYPDFVRHFRAVDEPGSANYVYLASDLADLPGRQFHQKRNLLAQAQKAYTHTVEPVTPQNLSDCRRVIAATDRDDGAALEGTLANERLALNATLDQFAALGQQGLLVRVDGEPVAFSLFERMTAETAVIHFEKARRQWKGIYQVINRETAAALVKQGVTFVNREEDLGNEGLRRAKESYNPVELKRSHVLTLLRE